MAIYTKSKKHSSIRILYWPESLNTCMMSDRLRVDTQEPVPDSDYIPFMSAHPQCPELQMALMLLADNGWRL